MNQVDNKKLSHYEKYKESIKAGVIKHREKKKVERAQQKEAEIQALINQFSIQVFNVLKKK